MKNRAFLVAAALIICACSIFQTLAGGSAPGGPFSPKSHPDSVSASVSANQDSTVQLDDGAKIIIPQGSLAGDASVTIERNPEKVKSLPTLGANDLPLSDFYNFQIQGGALLGPADLIIPFDVSKLPEKDGILVAMIPSGNTWKYVPVQAYQGKADLYTNELGDPLIAWHFVNVDADPSALAMCDPQIALSVDPERGPVGTKFKIYGQIKPLRSNLFSVIGSFTHTLAKDLSVTIFVNHVYVNSGQAFHVLTDSDGKFEVTVDSTTMNPNYHDGQNWVIADATCKPLPDNLTFASKGETFFYLTQEQAATESPTPGITETPETPTPQSQSILPVLPTDKIVVPNVMGMTLDEAQTTLEKLGFNTTWIDGKSNLDIGRIYAQRPTAGAPAVPHRTTVVLYRTIEKQALTPIGRLINDLEAVRYETSTCNQIDLDGNSINCHFVFQVKNNNGNVTTYSEFTDIDGKVRQHTGGLTLSDAIAQPLEGSFYSQLYWWLPKVGIPYDVEAVQSTGAGPVTAHTWIPGSVSTMNIAGYSFNAQQYSTEYDDIYIGTNQAGEQDLTETTHFSITAYYDKASGLLLHSEINTKETSCQTTTSWFPCSTYLGKTEDDVYEITQLQLNQTGQ